jgi:hypothetical protein
MLAELSWRCIESPFLRSNGKAARPIELPPRQTSLTTGPAPA